MVLATQLPKGIDNRIVGNCTTQFYGRQSAPVTIQAARDMLAARGMMKVGGDGKPQMKVRLPGLGKCAPTL